MLRKILFILLLLANCCAFSCVVSADPLSKNKDYQQYVDYFEKVYKIFEDNYYLPPDRAVYNQFLQKFNTLIYAQLKGEGKSDDYVRWRSAWYLVEALHSKDDRFTQFYPPKPAEKFQHEAMAQKVDLGIEGKKASLGFLVTRVEPHSDAYFKGLREEDTILQIDGQSVQPLPETAIDAKLTPVINTNVKLLVLSNDTKQQETLEVVSKEYFRQTVFLHQTPVEGVICLEINHFNEMTANEVYAFLKSINTQELKGLVIDFRGNPGGQLGGALEMSSFFLKDGDEFAYFQQRNVPKYDLKVPELTVGLKLACPMIILVDSGTGSCAELFAGIMQFKKRAYVLGVNTAGQILLKHIFPVGDGSTIGLVTARGHYPDGTVFGFDGITPDKIITDAPKDGLINLAAALIAHASQ